MDARRPHTAEVDGSSPSRATATLFELLRERYPDVVELFYIWYRLQKADRRDEHIVLQPIDTLPIAPFFGVFSGFLARYGVVMEINTEADGDFVARIKYRSLRAGWRTATFDGNYRPKVRREHTMAMRDGILLGSLFLNRELRARRYRESDMWRRVSPPPGFIETVEVGLRTSEYID